MPDLKAIRKRIASVESMQQITKTMEMVATAKIRHATERIVKATPYSEAMLEVLDSISSGASSADHPLLQEHEEIKNILVIVITSDRGLAGGFNSNVLRAAEQYVMARQAEGVHCEVITTGKKGLAYFRYRKLEPVLEFHDMSADPQISHARQIGSYCVAAYTKPLNDDLTEVSAEVEGRDLIHRADQVVLFYNHCKNVADQVLLQEQILPVNQYLFGKYADGEGSEKIDGDQSAIAAVHDTKEKVEQAQAAAADISSAAELSGAFEYEPGVAEVLDELLPSYVQTRLYHALLDSAAGEQGARRKAMKAASDNASDMITTLERVYNSVRQGAITTEITEIVGGAAALEDN
ncbi:MAG: ATP synthase F1 subunit gamma [Coriobacteriales bacterium]|jgi:F-type H+-transporting ATPase subunit gamma|nr:ATP synthase F1 subunit gamma [Coriobacteriales bacterium]